MTRRLLTALIATTAVFVLTVQAQEPVKVDPKNVKTTGERDTSLDPAQTAAQQVQLKAQFLDFKQSLLRLAQTLELSNKLEDKEKAKMIRTALEAAAKEGIDSKFAKIIEIFKSPKVMNDLVKLGEADSTTTELRRDLQNLIRILTSDNRSQQLREERLRTEKLLEQLKDLIRKQERIRAQTESSKRASKDIASDQGKVAEEAGKLVKGEGKGSKGNETKNKGEGKGPTGKEGKDGSDGRGTGKEDTGEAKSPAKSEDGKDKEGKANDGKGNEDGKQGPGKEGEPKGDAKGE